MLIETLRQRAQHAQNALMVFQLYQSGVEKLEHEARLPSSYVPPSPHFAAARHDQQKRRRPQCIAHRGYKARYPENTMVAFEAAVKAGANAIETDLHITADDVVVISHDATARRCFGKPQKIIDCEWDELKDLKTLAEPHVGMPRLVDLLSYLAQPGLEDVWTLLDIKLDNDADKIMRLISRTLAEVHISHGKGWNQRIVLGVWAAEYLALAAKYLPGFPIAHIGFSAPYARQFLELPNVAFNLLCPALIGPGGRDFLKTVREHHRQVFTWTANDAEKIEWSIRRQLDGVCTDNVGLFMEICDKFDDYRDEPLMPLTMRHYWGAFRIWIFIRLAMIFFGCRFAPLANRRLVRRQTTI